MSPVKTGGGTAYVENDPVTGQPLMLRTTTGQQSLYVWDGTGNPAALITSAAYQAFAYSYDPYGAAALTNTSGGHGVPENPYLFKGGIQDRTTGWIHYGARWYNTTTGQWTQQDTIDTPLNPANANRYAYAANDPINNLDLNGTVSISLVVKAIEALLAGRDALTVLGTGSDIEGATALFSIACGLMAGAIAAPTVAGEVIAAGGCVALSALFEEDLDEG